MLEEFDELPFPESAWGLPWIPFGLEDELDCPTWL